MKSPAWTGDVLGAGFEATTLDLGADAEGPVVATVVRHVPARSTRRAALYVHGFNDYFFQAELARWFADAGWAFYALDLRRYGRSLRPGQTANYTADLGEYDDELDRAAAIIATEGHDELLVVGHSTGGLIAPLWVARRPELPVMGLVLNSPFLEFRQPAAVRAALAPTSHLVARRRPTTAIPAGVSGLYGQSIHASAHGEWDYDLAWKPLASAPVRVGWLAAIVDGQHRAHEGLDLAVPLLVLASDRAVGARRWSPVLQTGDAVLDPDSIARWSITLGRHVTCLRLAGALHDVWLSPGPIRNRAYELTGRWLDAWLP